ncbi:MAG: pyridoxamine 5'-phosphate oxidase family protein [Nakamurella sp.]
MLVLEVVARGPCMRWALHLASILTGEPIFVGDKGGAVMELLRVRRLFVDEPVARLGMTGPGGQPRLTPVPFAMIDDGDDGVVVCSLDVEPRSLGAAAQLRGLAASPRVSFLVDHGELGPAQWWVQADGVAEVLRRGTSDPRFAVAAEALSQRYPERLASRFATVVWTTITGWNGWIAAADAAAAAA